MNNYVIAINNCEIDEYKKKFKKEFKKLFSEYYTKDEPDEFEKQIMNNNSISEMIYNFLISI